MKTRLRVKIKENYENEVFYDMFFVHFCTFLNFQSKIQIIKDAHLKPENKPILHIRKALI